MRFSRVLLAIHIALLIFPILFGIFSLTNKVSAQTVGEGVNGDKVGPELAFFDPNGQKKVNDNILIPNGFRGVTQAINSIHGAPYNPAPGTKVVLRIVLLHGEKINREGCNDPNPVPTTIKEVEDFAIALNSHPDFPPNTLVMFGNELNNLQKEYCYSLEKKNPSVMREAGRDYARLLKAFAAKLDHGPGKKYILAPTSLDPNNPEYSAKDFIAGIASAGGYGKDANGREIVDTLAQSVFDVAPAPDLEADITDEMVRTIPTQNRNLATYLAIEKLIGKTVTHFNGWGSAPQLDLRGQLNFLLNTPLPPGINGAATLIADNCGGKQGFATDSWFFFVKGKIFDVDGNEVNPDTCERSKDSAQASLYVYPGIDDQNAFDDKIKMAATYMMTCASPTAFSGKITNEDLIDKPSDQNYQSFGLQCPGGPSDTSCLIPEVTGTVFINHEQTTIPLFRFDRASAPDPANKLRRYNDLEDFFGSRYAPVARDFINDPLGNGVVRKLTADNTQCVQTVEFLKSIQKACAAPPIIASTINAQRGASASASTPTSPTAPAAGGVTARCAMDMKIPDINKTYLQVLGDFNAISAAEQDAVCGQTPLNSTRDFISNVNRVRGEIGAVETITPKAFKPAYIVRYINLPQCGPNESGPGCPGASNLLTKFQNWFSPDVTPEKKKNRIFITKVYVPAGFATTPDDVSNALTPQANTEYTSPFMGSVKSLVPKSLQEKYSKQKSDQIVEVENLTRSIGTNPDPGPDIREPNTSRFVNCPECGEDQSLEALFVKRINAEISREHAGDEFNPDCAQPNLAGETAKTHKVSINPEGNPDPVNEIAVSAKATLKAKQEPHGPEVRMRTYFFLPEEYRNVSQYEDALAQTFIPNSLQPSLTYSDSKIEGDKDKYYRYLQLSDTAPKFGRNGLTVHVSSPSKEGSAVGVLLGFVKDEVTKLQTAFPQKTLNLEGSISGDDLNTFDINPQVPGGKMARALWDIMCRVTRPFQPGQAIAKYNGFEAFLDKGPAACYTPATPAPTAKEQCSPPADTVTTKSALNSPAAEISDGLIALALQVSKYTCTPAEMLIGVLAKESQGSTYPPNPDGRTLNSSVEIPLTGDPNEKVMRQFWSLDYFEPLNPNATNAPRSSGPVAYYYGSGAYQYSQQGIEAQIRVYNDAVRDCLAGLEINLSSGTKKLDAADQDTRKVGVSMCVAAANMWRGTTCSKVRECDSTPAKIEDLSTAEVENGVLTFHSNDCDPSLSNKNKDSDGAWQYYQAFIDAYKDDVARVRNSLQCATN